MTERDTSTNEKRAALLPDTVHAIGELQTILQDQGASQDILDTYLYTKKLLAEYIKELLLAELPESCPEFHRLLDALDKEMSALYANVIPEKYLRVRYRSRTHETLFTILLQHLGEPVRADRLRYSTQDSVHTERRVREFRELGFEINTSTADGANYYTLESLNMDLSVIPTIIKNNLREKRASAEVQREVLALLGV